MSTFWPQMAHVPAGVQVRVLFESMFTWSERTKVSRGGRKQLTGSSLIELITDGVSLADQTGTTLCITTLPRYVKNLLFKHLQQYILVTMYVVIMGRNWEFANWFTVKCPANDFWRMFIITYPKTGRKILSPLFYWNCAMLL